MLVSVLQDQPGVAGKALIPHPAGLSTKPRVRPGKGVNSQGGFQVAGALRSVQKHAGNEGMGAAPLQPTLSAPSPPFLRSPGWCPGAGRSGAPEVGRCAGRGAGTARGWVLKNPDTAGLEARHGVLPSPCSARGRQGSTGQELSGVLVIVRSRGTVPAPGFEKPPGN